MSAAEPGRWWEEHLERRVADDRRASERQEVRAHVLAGVCGSALIAAWALWDRGAFVGIGWAAGIAGLAAGAALMAAGAAFLLVLWPLEGSRFLPHSPEDRLYRAMLGGAGGWLRARCTHALEPELAQRLEEIARRASIPTERLAGEPAARACVARWLSARLHTDLAAWMDDAERAPIRMHLAMMCWAADQQAQAKAVMVQAGLRLCGAAAGLAAAGALLSGGWWGWLIVGAAAGWGLWRWAEIDLGAGA